MPLSVSDPPPLRHAVALAAEFQYPANWLADQTLYFRAAQRAEAARSLDPPALKRPRGRQVTEPSAAFGPPGSRCVGPLTGAEGREEGYVSAFASFASAGNVVAIPAAPV